MNTRTSPKQLAVDLCARSSCQYKMAAVLHDKTGIFAWGWNSSGPDGMGQHAEDMALRRANRRRLEGATMTVAGIKPSGRGKVLSAPCSACMKLIMASGLKKVVYFQPQNDTNGGWFEDNLA